MKRVKPIWGRIAAAERGCANLRFWGGCVIDSEDALCVACRQYFDTVLPSSPFGLIHIPNGGSRNPIEGAKFKRMGVRAGVPDYLVMKDFQPVGWLEFKYGRNTLTEAQKVFRNGCLAGGVKWAEIRSVDEFIHTLKEWGVFENGHTTRM